MRTLLCMFALVAGLSTLWVDPVRAEETLDRLERFAEDYARDPSATVIEFGVQVDGAWFTVDAGTEDVEVREGEPATPTFYYMLSSDTLAKIDAGEMNALTASGKARSSDEAPMEFGTMDGYEPPADLGDLFRSLTFHFWTRGLPETIPFGEAFARTVHGAEASVLFYDTGFRSSYYAYKPGQHANEDPADQVNEFPSLIVVLVGPLYGRIDGKEVTLESGKAYLIPEGQAHEFWNPADAEHSAETLLFMFGDGA